MSLSDHDFVNFSEDYELNYHLKKVDKSQSKDNRATLIEMGKERKAELGKTVLTHEVFHAYVKTQLSRLD